MIENLEYSSAISIHSKRALAHTETPVAPDLEANSSSGRQSVKIAFVISGTIFALLTVYSIISSTQED